MPSGSATQASVLHKASRSWQGQPDFPTSLHALQALLLGAHRKAKALASPEESEQFWARSGSRLEAQQRAAAIEVVAAFKAFSAADLVTDTKDRHLVNQVQRYLAEGG
jgi:hypothetical protein